MKSRLKMTREPRETKAKAEEGTVDLQGKSNVKSTRTRRTRETLTSLPGSTPLSLMRTNKAQLSPWPRRHGIIFHPPFHQRIVCYHLCYLLSGEACAVLYLIVYLYIAPYIDCSFYTQLRFFRLHFETETKTGSRRCMNYGNQKGCKLIRLPLLQFEPQCVVLDILHQAECISTRPLAIGRWTYHRSSVRQLQL